MESKFLSFPFDKYHVRKKYLHVLTPIVGTWLKQQYKIVFRREWIFLAVVYVSNPANKRRDCFINVLHKVMMSCIVSSCHVTYVFEAKIVSSSKNVFFHGRFLTFGFYVNIWKKADFLTENIDKKLFFPMQKFHYTSLFNHW